MKEKKEIYFAYKWQRPSYPLNFFWLITLNTVYNSINQRCTCPRGRVASIVVLTLSSLLPHAPVDGRDPLPSELPECFHVMWLLSPPSLWKSSLLQIGHLKTIALISWNIAHFCNEFSRWLPLLSPDSTFIKIFKSLNLFLD